MLGDGRARCRRVLAIADCLLWGISSFDKFQTVSSIVAPFCSVLACRRASVEDFVQWLHDVHLGSLENIARQKQFTHASLG